MFFDEIKEVEKSVNDLKTDLVAIKNGVEGSFDQLDDIAAHIIAVEAILVQVPFWLKCECATCERT